MIDILLFEREEVHFIHDDEDFIFTFHRFDSGKITFKRLWPAAKFQEGEVVLYPQGEKSVANTAVIVLYRAASAGTKMEGFLPDVLRTIMSFYPNREALAANLTKSIQSFPVQSQIASVDDIMKFIAPYTPWTVSSDAIRANMKNGIGTKKYPISLSDLPEAQPDATSLNLPKTTNPAPLPNSAGKLWPLAPKPNSPAIKNEPTTPVKQSKPNPTNGSPLTDVLNQPASKKRALEPDPKENGSPTKKKANSPPPAPKLANPNLSPAGISAYQAKKNLAQPRPASAASSNGSDVKRPPSSNGVTPIKVQPKSTPQKPALPFPPADSQRLNGNGTPKLTPTKTTSTNGHPAPAAKTATPIKPKEARKSATPHRPPTTPTSAIAQKSIPTPVSSKTVPSPKRESGPVQSTPSIAKTPPSVRSENSAAGTNGDVLSLLMKLHVEKTKLKDVMTEKAKVVANGAGTSVNGKVNGISNGSPGKLSESQPNTKANGQSVVVEPTTKSMDQPLKQTTANSGSTTGGSVPAWKDTLTAMEIDDPPTKASDTPPTPNGEKSGIIIKLPTRLLSQIQSPPSSTASSPEKSSSTSNKTLSGTAVTQPPPVSTPPGMPSPMKTRSSSKSPVLTKKTPKDQPAPQSPTASIASSLISNSPQDTIFLSQKGMPSSNATSLSNSSVALRAPIPSPLVQRIVIKLSPNSRESPDVPPTILEDREMSIDTQQTSSTAPSGSSCVDQTTAQTQTVTLTESNVVQPTSSDASRTVLPNSLTTTGSFHSNILTVDDFFFEEERRIDEQQRREKEARIRNHLAVSQSKCRDFEIQLSEEKSKRKEMEEQHAKVIQELVKEAEERNKAHDAERETSKKKLDEMETQVSELERARAKAEQDLDNAYVVHERVLEQREEEYKKKEEELKKELEETKKQRDEMAKNLAGIQNMAKGWQFPFFGSGS